MTYEDYLLDYLRYYRGQEVSYAKALTQVRNRVTGKSDGQWVPREHQRQVWIELRVILDSLIKQRIVIRHLRKVRGKWVNRIRINEAFAKIRSISRHEKP